MFEYVVCDYVYIWGVRTCVGVPVHMCEGVCAHVWGNEWAEEGESTIGKVFGRRYPLH